MDAKFWQLFLAAGFAPNKARDVLEYLGSFPDPSTALLSWPKLSDEQRNRIDKLNFNYFDKVMSQGVSLLKQKDYPELLSHTTNPPLALFIWGDTSCLDQPTIAIVGTRGASTYGKAAAMKFAQKLSDYGITIVSGGALGIDSSAHKGALESGRTAAVLGTGIDQVFPSSNKQLFDQIKSQGCLLSPFAVGTPSLGHNFVYRNDIIAGLSSAVLVVESPAGSGALHTARAAAELGRQVFVVPGAITTRGFKGSHNLIRDGATLVDHPDQIIEDMGWQNLSTQQSTLEFNSEQSEIHQKILSCLSSEPALPETFVDETGLDTQTLLSELTMLELEGLVIHSGEGYSLKP